MSDKKIRGILSNSQSGNINNAEDKALSVCETALSSSERRLRSMLELGRLIGLDLQLDDMLIQIASKAKEVMDADRFTILLYDSLKDELWTKMALEMEGKVLRTPSNVGIAGHCFHSGETVNVEDAYEDPRFFRYIDEMTGYKTKSMLCMPFFSRSGPPLGVIQLINKREGFFTAEDEELLRTFSNHAAVFIELAQLQKARIDALEEARKELERLNRAKGKALDHLSHELKTPLALIQGSLRVLKKKALFPLHKSSLEDFFTILDKYLSRLFDVQRESEKIILTYRQIEEENIVDEIEDLLKKLERSEADVPYDTKELWTTLKKILVSYVPRQKDEHTMVSLYPMTEDIIIGVRKNAPHRDLEISLFGDKKSSVIMDRGIVRDMIAGLVKNAVENTPDGGLIEISLNKENQDEVTVSVRDYGVGITEENQEYIFEGFFHTQDTTLYGSKKPYDFGAGGKGLDLLQMKIYGQRFRFNISLQSDRCVYIPTDNDPCPGRISLCPHITNREGCLASGGSTFCLTFPAMKEYLKFDRDKDSGLSVKGSIYDPKRSSG